MIHYFIYCAMNSYSLATFKLSVEYSLYTVYMNHSLYKTNTNA